MTTTVVGDGLELFALNKREQFGRVKTSAGQILDGRNRLRACQAADVEPRFVTYHGTDLCDYVVRVNIKRRHLTRGQADFVGLGLIPLYEAEAKARQGTRTDLQQGNIPADLPECLPRRERESRHKAAKAVGASGRGVGQAKETLGADLHEVSKPSERRSTHKAAKAVGASGRGGRDHGRGKLVADLPEAIEPRAVQQARTTSKEASTMRNPNVNTIVGVVSAEPFTVNDRTGRRRRAGFQIDVHRRWYVARIESHREATTTFDVRCAGYVAENALTQLTLGDRIVAVGHFEQTECGLLQLHADVIGVALPDEKPTDEEEEAP